MRYFETFIRSFLPYISPYLIIFRLSSLFEFYYFETITFFRIKYIDFYLNFILYPSIRFLSHMVFFKYIVIVRKICIKVFIKAFIIADRVVIRETTRGISRIILSILIISNRYRFRVRFVKKTPFKTVNFDVIKKKFPFRRYYSKINFAIFKTFKNVVYWSTRFSIKLFNSRIVLIFFVLLKITNVLALIIIIIDI